MVVVLLGTGGCAGSTAELAFEYVSSSKGLVQEFQYPYTSYYGKDSACSVLNVAAKATIDGYGKREHSDDPTLSLNF